jgi:hypothetical protein
MDTEQLLKQFEQHSTKAIEYLSERSNLEKIGKITAISVATYYTLNVRSMMKKDCVMIFF